MTRVRSVHEACICQKVLRNSEQCKSFKRDIFWLTFWTRSLKIDVWWNLLMLEGKNTFYQTGQTSSSLGMPNIRLDLYNFIMSLNHLLW
jgi:hypothetical protein